MWNTKGKSFKQYVDFFSVICQFLLHQLFSFLKIFLKKRWKCSSGHVVTNFENIKVFSNIELNCAKSKPPRNLECPCFSRNFRPFHFRAIFYPLSTEKIAALLHLLSKMNTEAKWNFATHSGILIEITDPGRNLKPWSEMWLTLLEILTIRIQQSSDNLLIALKNCILFNAPKISNHTMGYWSISTLWIVCNISSFRNQQNLNAMNGHRFEKVESKMQINVKNWRIVEYKY